MRRIPFILLLTLLTNICNGQIFQEDFETGDLGQFTAFDEDGNTLETDEIWITDGTWMNNPILLGNNATSTSNYQDNAQPDNWMISSAIEIPEGTGFTLYWNEAILGGTGESYEVIISNESSVSDFTDTPVYVASGNIGGPLNVSANVDDYAGQTVYLAFHHFGGTQGYIYIDDIEITQESIGYDMMVTDIYMNATQRLEERIIRGVVQNLAAEVISSFDINYSIDGGQVQTHSVSGVELFNQNSYLFEHNITWTPSGPNEYAISVWASNLNGNEDQVPENDVLSENFSVVEAASKEVLLEVFTSSTCGPCAYYNERTEPIFAAAPFQNNTGIEESRLNVIKYHVEIPVAGDPSVNAESLARADHYNITAAPYTIYDGEYIFGLPGDTALYEMIQAPAFVELDMTASYNQNNQLEVSVDINPIADLSEEYALHIVATNMYYEFDGQNEETYFKNTLRKMLPDENGTALSVLVTGESQTVNVSYSYSVSELPSAGSHDFWNEDMGIIAFVQNTETDEIIQSTFVQADFTSAIQNSPEASLLAVFPNPTDSEINIILPELGSNDTKLIVQNIAGQLVMSQMISNPSAGSVLKIETESWVSGLYFMSIQGEKKSFNQKVVVR